MNSEHRTVNMEGSRSNTRRRKIPSSGSSNSEVSTRDSNYSSHKNKRKICYQSHSHDEFKKARLLTFNGDINNNQEVEDWLLGMSKYFQFQDFSANMKARVAIFHLTRRASIWWEHFRKVKKISERNIVWKQFHKFFRHKYLSDGYYDGKIK